MHFECFNVPQNGKTEERQNVEELQHMPQSLSRMTVASSVGQHTFKGLDELSLFVLYSLLDVHST